MTRRRIRVEDLYLGDAFPDDFLVAPDGFLEFDHIAREKPLAEIVPLRPDDDADP